MDQTCSTNFNPKSILTDADPTLGSKRLRRHRGKSSFLHRPHPSPHSPDPNRHPTLLIYFQSSGRIRIFVFLLQPMERSIGTVVVRDRRRMEEVAGLCV